MLGKRINSEKDIPLYAVKELLKARIEEGEPTYEQSVSYDYVNKFSKLTEAKGVKFMEELTKIEGVDEGLAIKIADIMPEEMEKLKLLVAKDSKLDDAALENILKLVKKYLK